jgi:hypothetical protein
VASTKASTRIDESDSNTEDGNLMYYLSNTTLSVTQILSKADTEKELHEKREKVISKIKEMCDIFNKYSQSDRMIYLEEMHLILRLLTVQEVFDHVVPSFSIFVDESEELKVKFLGVLKQVIQHILKAEFDNAVDQILIHVFPNLESMIKKTIGDIQDICIDTLEDICKQIGK